jgi:hypothetical protein
MIRKVLPERPILDSEGIGDSPAGDDVREPD